MSVRTIEPVKDAIHSRLRPPGSKSITIRALVAAGLADGRSHLYGALTADDTAAMVRTLRAFGVEIDDVGEPWTVDGTGGHLHAPSSPVAVGQSGLTARIALVLAAHADGVTRIEAEGRLLDRPISALVGSLERQGAAITTRSGHLPVTVEGVGGLWGGQIDIDASQTSQFATALMLVAPLMREGASLRLEDLESSIGYAELTARVMEDFGANVTPMITGFEVEQGAYSPRDYVIEPDASAAAYPMVAAAITGGDVEIIGLSPGSAQPDIKVASVLEEMGCAVEDSEDGMTLRSHGRLSGVDVDMSNAPDGALAVAVASMFADSPSRISGLSSLQHKESDRMSALQAEMGRLGCIVEADRDAMTVEPANLRGAIVDSHGDHRIAMSFAIVGFAVPGVSVSNAEVVSKTWPGFWEAMSKLGNPKSLRSPPMTRALVTLDGPAGTGKSTVSRAVAEAAGLPHLDTGAFYRAATLAALRSGVSLEDVASVTAVVANAVFDQTDGRMSLDGDDVSTEIREERVTEAVSLVSSYPEVREILVEHQRRWVAEHGGGGVVEGRDIGTAVFPDADVKIYLDASQTERARRRALQTGEDPGAVLEDLDRRDRFDSSREASPLTVPGDAVVVDTTNMTFEEVVDTILNLIPG